MEAEGMRIEACTKLGNQIKMVWHCEECRKVLCAWADTDTKQYAEYVKGERGILPGPVVRQAKEIFFDRQVMVIFINPIDNEAEDESISTMETVKA